MQCSAIADLFRMDESVVLVLMQEIVHSQRILYMLVSLTHSRRMPECPPVSAGSASGNIHFMPSDKCVHCCYHM